MRAAILGMALVLVGGAAAADPAGARSHFLSGLELYSEGRYAAALEEYRAAWLTWEDPELLLDMAECNRHLGNVDEARQQYRGFLARAPHSPLRGSVERQLMRLDAAEAAPPPAELVAVPSSARRSDEAGAPHAGRVAKALGIAGWAAGAAAMALGVYTWNQTQALQNAAHADLVALRPTNPLGGSAEERAFFISPSCSPPSSLAGTDAYRRDCNRGEQYSAATSALFISSAALGAAATIAYIVGVHQAPRPRAVEVAPVVSLNGAALQLRFPF